MSVKWKHAPARLAAAVVAGVVVLGGVAAVVVGGGVGGQSHADTRASIEIPSSPPPSPWPK
ncbi:MAG TPA: hypothetical protein VF486_25525 [Actinomycetes bacterium]